jgi:pilus assembly protein Flp/PilA
MWKVLCRKIRSEKGQGLVEYGLIIGLIAIIVVAVFIAIGPQLKKMFMSEGKEPVKQETTTKEEASGPTVPEEEKESTE